MKVTIIFTMLLLATGCTTLFDVPDEFSRCDVDKNEWRLLTKKPENSQSLIDSLDFSPPDEDAFLFIDMHENILYCRVNDRKHLSKDPRWLTCGSTRFVFVKSGNTWVDKNPSGEPDINICGGQ